MLSINQYNNMKQKFLNIYWFLEENFIELWQNTFGRFCVLLFLISMVNVLMGCGPSVNVIETKENTQEAIFNDFTAYELCPDEQIEYMCQQCAILYPEEHGVCGHTFDNGDVCIAGYVHFDDFIECTKRETDSTKCTLCK